MNMPSREPFRISGTKYQILDRRLVETTVADVPYAVISITGSEQSHPPIAESPHRLGVMRIKFDDIQAGIPDMVLFNAQHARKILDFVAEMRAKGVKQFIINCEQGRCRSAAIGAAIVELSGGRTSWFDRRFAPNAHVKRVMLEEGRRQRQNAVGTDCQKGIVEMV